MPGFDDFLRIELRGLTRFAGALTGDQQLGYDVLTDALIKAMKRWDHIQRLESPLNYVRKMVARNYFDHLRKERRRRTTATEQFAAVEDPTSSSALVAVDDRDTIDRLLAGLNPRQHAAVALKYLFDCSTSEIGDILGLRESAVRSVLTRGLSNLRISASITTAQGGDHHE